MELAGGAERLLVLINCGDTWPAWPRSSQTGFLLLRLAESNFFVFEFLVLRHLDISMFVFRQLGSLLVISASNAKLKILLPLSSAGAPPAFHEAFVYPPVS